MSKHYQAIVKSAKVRLYKNIKIKRNNRQQKLHMKNYFREYLNLDE